MHNWNPRYTSCPAGTRWYVCSNNKFSGCCPIDPCDQEACPTNALTTTLQISSHSDILSSTTTSSSHRVSPTATSDPDRSISPDPGKTTGLPVLTAVGLALGALVIGKILGILMWILIRKYLWVRWVQKPDLAPGGAHTRVQGRSSDNPEDTLFPLKLSW